MTGTTYDFIIVGAGSAGCAVADQLIAREAGTVAVIEAGPSDNHWRVKTPMALNWLMGSQRDWQFKTSPQKHAGGRQIGIPRGKMVGGSGSINSMVWFRGIASDFDGWNVDGWSWADVEPAFEAIEARIQPDVFANAHPLTKKLNGLLGANDDRPPVPDYESAGVFRYNMRNGRRWSAADAFLRLHLNKGVTLITGQQIHKTGLVDQRAKTVHFTDGTILTANKGIILSAGSIGSTMILMNSGIGPKEDLDDTVLDAPLVGANLHDHPGCGLHFEGQGTGYGLTIGQAPMWAMAPLSFMLAKSGPLASPTVEGGMFFNARGDSSVPDVQSHFIPFLLNHRGSKYTYGQGYFADVCVCRPKSRGALRKTKNGFDIDFNLLADPSDLDTMVAGATRLRELLKEAGTGGTEVHPGPNVTDDALADHIRKSCGTAYHPVGTIALGGPIDYRCKVKGLDGLWVADASVMPNVTSANTNAPSMMIGYRAGQMIAEDAA